MDDEDDFDQSYEMVKQEYDAMEPPEEEEISVDTEEVVDMADEYIIEQIDYYDPQFLNTNLENDVDHNLPEEIEKLQPIESKQRHRNSQCRFCGLVLSRRSKKIEHERLHVLEETQEFYSCFLCGKSFNQKTGLVPHFKSCHGFVQ